MKKRTIKVLAIFLAVAMMFSLMLIVACDPVISSTDTSSSDGPTITTTPDDPTIAVTSVMVAGGPISIQLGSATLTAQLTATALPANATYPEIVWSSINSAIATVSEAGLVTAVGAGTTQIRATAHNGLFGSANVTVTAAPVLATGIAIAGGDLNVGAGVTQQLTVNFTPADTTNRTVTWATSNAAAATVSATGLVTAVALGEATITATAACGNHTASIVVTVRERLQGGIATAEEFQNMTLDGFYFLENDIDFTGFELLSIRGTDVAAVPSDANSFRGTFDGRGFALNNITTRAPADNYVTFDTGAVFHRVFNATIRNVVVYNATLAQPGGSNGLFIGRVAGNSLIENVVVHGQITAYYAGARGYWDRNSALFGQVDAGSSIIRNVVADVTIASPHPGSRNLARASVAGATFENVFIVGDNIPDFSATRHFREPPGAASTPTLTNVHAFMRANLPNFSALTPNTLWDLSGTLPTLIPNQPVPDVPPPPPPPVAVILYTGFTLGGATWRLWTGTGTTSATTPANTAPTSVPAGANFTFGLRHTTATAPATMSIVVSIDGTQHTFLGERVTAGGGGGGSIDFRFSIPSAQITGPITIMNIVRT